ncbi:MAG: hypothetical protein LBU19_04660, partial [Treponema sp.]|nr:hypothetical protein [Treponema sp.]
MSLAGGLVLAGLGMPIGTAHGTGDGEVWVWGCTWDSDNAAVFTMNGGKIAGNFSTSIPTSFKLRVESCLFLSGVGGRKTAVDFNRFLIKPPVASPR